MPHLLLPRGCSSPGGGWCSGWSRERYPYCRALSPRCAETPPRVGVGVCRVVTVVRGAPATTKSCSCEPSPRCWGGSPYANVSVQHWHTAQALDRGDPVRLGGWTRACGCRASHTHARAHTLSMGRTLVARRGPSPCRPSPLVGDSPREVGTPAAPGPYRAMPSCPRARSCRTLPHGLRSLSSLPKA